MMLMGRTSSRGTPGNSPFIGNTLFFKNMFIHNLNICLSNLFSSLHSLSILKIAGRPHLHEGFYVLEYETMR